MSRAKRLTDRAKLAILNAFVVELAALMKANGECDVICLVERHAFEAKRQGFDYAAVSTYLERAYDQLTAD